MEGVSCSTTLRPSELAPVASDLLTVHEVAQRLRLDEGTLANWRRRSDKRRLLPFVRIGYVIRYRAADVDAFIESRTVAA
jgi:hypothetical protein